MGSIDRRWIWAVLAWSGAALVMIVPAAITAFSPYLAYRTLPYIVGGFAGVISLSLLFIQPLLPAGYLAGSEGSAGRRWHRWVGVALVVAVVLHVGGLYLTSPPDTIDALLLISPTPFSIYGVTAMWGVVATAALVVFRRRLGLRFSIWRLIHNGLAAIVVVATVIHALQIEGAMEPITKWMLCMATLAAMSVALLDLRVVRPIHAWRNRGSTRGAKREPSESAIR
ncbi:ferric reductase-like transmembrane domain-containing protein [Microvirga antarctica]|uniref:ferric reductase-like transmembrane domain-containing protein n=1 Tax=Microvirga antarctica TaxID=2819233 RepID=UPI001B3019E5|nr:ferric reductase-like transmembrane domain-containing protein [Microvirga antarctica]